MGWLSLRLASFVLFGGTASLLGYASPAFAQIPALPATAAPAPVPGVLPAPAPTLPPAPPPPPVTALPASPNAPPPAKADRITTTDAPADGAPEAGREGDEPDDEFDGPPSKRPQWYGWQTLIADAPSLTAFMAGVSMVDDGNSGGSTLAWAGILGYELVPGIIHFAHGNPGRGFASLGMRFGMPLAGAIVGAAVSSNCDSSLCELGGAGVGIMLGMGGAIAIDAAVLAYDDPKPSQARHRRLVPLASLTPQRAWIGVGGEL